MPLTVRFLLPVLAALLVSPAFSQRADYERVGAILKSIDFMPQ